MPEKVFNQIRYLCQQIAKVEWSGVLYYKTEGSIKDPANMVLTLEEILPLNKGTGSYTEYEFGKAFVEHMMENEHLDDCKVAHIHSHHSMSVFFSVTDWSELEDNAPNHNIYLSLIVNNSRDFCAKICFIVESADTKKFDFTAKDENGEKYVYSSENYEVNNRKLIVYDCDIIAPIEKDILYEGTIIKGYNKPIIVDDSFKVKVNTIIEEANKRVTVTTSFGVGNTHRVTPVSTYGRDWNSRVNSHKEKEERDAWDDSWDARNYSAPIEKDENEDALEDAIEDFTMFVLNTGNPIEEFYSITDIVKNYKGYNLSGRALAKGILDKYVPVYEKFFDELPDKDDPKMFMHITEQVIENLEDERDSSTLKYMEEMLNPSIEGLKSMLKSFKNFEKVK